MVQRSLSWRWNSATLRSAGLFVAVAALGLAPACDDHPVAPGNTASTNLRVLHLSPDAPAVDVFLNQGTSAAVTGLEFSEGTDYLQAPSGTYRVDVTPAGNPVSNAVLTVPGLSLGADRFYTAVALDELASIQALAVEDNFSALGTGMIRVRAIHAAATVGQVDIWNIPATGSPSLLYENVDFAMVGGVIDLAAGAYTLGFDLDDDATPDVVFSLPSLAAGTMANVFAVSEMGGTAFLLAQLQSGATVRIDAN